MAVAIVRAQFWERVGILALNERPIKVLNRLLDGFLGKLTSSKWAMIAKCAQNTTNRGTATLSELGGHRKCKGRSRRNHPEIAAWRLQSSEHLAQSFAPAGATLRIMKLCIDSTFAIRAAPSIRLKNPAQAVMVKGAARQPDGFDSGDVFPRNHGVDDGFLDRLDRRQIQLVDKFAVQLLFGQDGG